MADKSCGTCEYHPKNGCCELRCINDCPMADATNNYRCKCRDVTDFEDCPYYKKYEPTPSANEISSEE